MNNYVSVVQTVNGPRATIMSYENGVAIPYMTSPVICDTEHKAIEDALDWAKSNGMHLDENMAAILGLRSDVFVI